jgi:hypothetical protein
MEASIGNSLVRYLNRYTVMAQLLSAAKTSEIRQIWTYFVLTPLRMPTDALCVCELTDRNAHNCALLSLKEIPYDTWLTRQQHSTKRNTPRLWELVDDCSSLIQPLDFAIFSSFLRFYPSLCYFWIPLRLVHITEQDTVWSQTCQRQNMMQSAQECRKVRMWKCLF